MRSNSGKPMLCSMRANSRLTVGCDVCSSSAARSRCRRSSRRGRLRRAGASAWQFHIKNESIRKFKAFYWIAHHRHHGAPVSYRTTRFSPWLDPRQLTELAAQHGTPLWVYDAAVIRERIAQLRRFDVIRYAQKANSNIHILADARRGSGGRRRVAGRDRAQPGRGFPTRGRAGRHRIHRRPDRPRHHGRRDPARHPGQRRLAGHARTRRPAGARPPRLAAHQSRLRPRPQQQDQHWRPAKQARHLDRRRGSGHRHRAATA